VINFVTAEFHTEVIPVYRHNYGTVERTTYNGSISYLLCHLQEWVCRDLLSHSTHTISFWRCNVI